MNMEMRARFLLVCVLTLAIGVLLLALAARPARPAACWPWLSSSLPAMCAARAAKPKKFRRAAGRTGTIGRMGSTRASLRALRPGVARGRAAFPRPQGKPAAVAVVPRARRRPRRDPDFRHAFEAVRRTFGRQDRTPIAPKTVKTLRVKTLRVNTSQH